MKIWEFAGETNHWKCICEN